MYKKLSCYIIAIVISVLVYPILLVTSIELVAFNQNFYINQYEKLDTASSIGISKSELHKVTWELLDYVKGEKDTLNDIEAEIKGDTRQVFNEKEIAHMVDVKDLFGFASNVRTFSIISMVLLLIVIFLVNNKEALRKLSASFLWTTGIFLVLASILLILVKSNFTYYWDLFHHIFFDNDLWLLDPKTDIMIQMVPQPFFYSAVTRVIIYFSIASIILAIASTIYIVLSKNKTRTSTN